MPLSYFKNSTTSTLIWTWLRLLPRIKVRLVLIWIWRSYQRCSSRTSDGIIAGMSVTDARKATFDFSDSLHCTNTILRCKIQILLLLMKISRIKPSWCEKTGRLSKHSFHEPINTVTKVKTFRWCIHVWQFEPGAIDAVMDDRPVLRIRSAKVRVKRRSLELSSEVAFAVRKAAIQVDPDV